MLCQPCLFDFGHGLVIRFAPALGSPGDNRDFVTVALYLVQQTSQRGEVHQRLCDFVGLRIFSLEVVQPASHAIEVGDGSIHVEVDTHF